MLNPYLSFFLLPSSEHPEKIVLHAPIRGRQCIVTNVYAAKTPELFSVLRCISQRIVTGREIDLKISSRTYEMLQKMGVLLRRARISHPPLFDAPISEMKLGPAPTGKTGEWMVNPTFRKIPKKDLAFALSRLAGRKQWIEVKAPGFLAPSIYSTDQKQLRGLRAGKSFHGKFSLKRLAPLVQAGILIDRSELQALNTKRSLNEAKFALKQNGYVCLTNLFSSGLIAAVAEYYRKLMDSGFLPLGDEQVVRRYSLHNESIARLLHLRMTDLVSVLAVQRVKPSFVFFGSYAEGAELTRHTDRNQCEFSISLLIDYQPVPQGKSPWPLYLKPPGRKPVAIHQSIGDGILYRGRELAHWRPVLPQGNCSTSLFFHYVRKDFTGVLD
jgi:hypothetical protein